MTKTRASANQQLTQTPWGPLVPLFDEPSMRLQCLGLAVSHAAGTGNANAVELAQEFYAFVAALPEAP